MANEKVSDAVARCPDFSPTDYTLYANHGFAYIQRQAALSAADDPNNPWYTRVGMLVLGTAATPLAWAEEYIGRPIANIPFTIVNAPVKMAENMGCAGILLELKDGQTSEAVPYLLSATAHGAEGFVAVGSVLVPAEGVISQGGASRTVSKTEQVVNNEEILTSKVVNKTDDEAAKVADKTDEVAKVADKTSAIEETSTVFRVQGGNHPNPNKRSKFLIAIDEGNTPVINKNERLNISIGDDSHVEYFLTQRPGGEVVSFEIPKWMDDFIEESSLPQFKAKTNPLYDKATTPLSNDPTTPGRTFELPPIWVEWLEEVAIPGSGKVIKTNQ